MSNHFLRLAGCECSISYTFNISGWILQQLWSRAIKRQGGFSQAARRSLQTLRDLWGNAFRPPADGGCTSQTRTARSVLMRKLLPSDSYYLCSSPAGRIENNEKIIGKCVRITGSLPSPFDLGFSFSSFSLASACRLIFVLQVDLFSLVYETWWSYIKPFICKRRYWLMTFHLKRFLCKDFGLDGRRCLHVLIY